MFRLLRLALLLLAALAAAGCATMRQYHTPVTAMEGRLMAPALVTAAERQGLRAYNHGDRVQVVLEDGTDLYWATAADNTNYALTVHLPGETPEDALEPRFQAAHGRAEQLWSQAVAMRQASMPATVVVLPGQYPVAAQPMTVQRQCRFGTDCGSGEFCRDRGDGVQLCMGHGGRGDFCAWGTDCGSGLFCRDAGAGLKRCQ